MLCLCFSFLLTTTEPSLERLHAAVTEAAEKSTGEMGVAIEHLESGLRIDVRGDVAYPMASTFKLPLLVTLFHLVDEGKVRLDEMVSLERGDVHIGSGRLDDFVAPGISLSVANLAALMMRVSDNSAADELFSRVGPESVRERLRALGIEGISVDRTAQRLILDSLGMPPESTEGMDRQEILAYLNAYQPEPGELEAAASAFEVDPRDTATPLAMNDLLRAIYSGRAASPSSTLWIREILLACETGTNRIPGRLPEGAPAAHKTGTLGGAVADVGVLYLPDGRGHVLISVLTRGVEDREKAENAIAEIARYAYDYFQLSVSSYQLSVGSRRN
jgi:beta-lactamase class A